MTIRDPETDKLLPEPESFGVWLAKHDKGAFHEELSEEKQRLVAECEANAKATAPRTVKGQMTVVINFAVDDAGAVVVSTDLKVKHPPKIRGVGRYYVDGGNLVKHDPKQPALPFREIEGGKRGEGARDVPARPAAIA